MGLEGVFSLLEGVVSDAVLPYANLFLAVICGYVIAKAFYWLSTKFIKVFTAKTKTKLDDILIEHLEKPIVFLIFVAAVYYGFIQLPLSEGATNVIGVVFQTIFVFSITWTIISVIDSFFEYYIKPFAAKTESDLDDQLLPVIKKLYKIVLWVIVIMMFLRRMDYDISALLTGAGLGGLAFALAAQDLLSNLFGGIAILTDKPFKVGDRIKIGANDGFVVEIGLRTTRMKTFDGTQLVIPNSEVAKTVLENVSREKARRVKIVLGLEYDTSVSKMKEAQKLLRHIIRENKKTDNDSIVSFTEFADSSLNITLIYWIKDLDKILQVQNEINFEIKKEFEHSGISMAFPTRTVHMIHEESNDSPKVTVTPIRQAKANVKTKKKTVKKKR